MNCPPKAYNDKEQDKKRQAPVQRSPCVVFFSVLCFCIFRAANRTAHKTALGLPIYTANRKCTISEFLISYSEEIRDAVLANQKERLLQTRMLWALLSNIGSPAEKEFFNTRTELSPTRRNEIKTLPIPKNRDNTLNKEGIIARTHFPRIKFGNHVNTLYNDTRGHTALSLQQLFIHRLPIDYATRRRQDTDGAETSAILMAIKWEKQTTAA